MKLNWQTVSTSENYKFDLVLISRNPRIFLVTKNLIYNPSHLSLTSGELEKIINHILWGVFAFQKMLSDKIEIFCLQNNNLYSVTYKAELTNPMTKLLQLRISNIKLTKALNLETFLALYCDKSLINRQYDIYS